MSSWKTRDALLIKLWNEGKKARDIATHWDGVTAAAVIGRARRLKLASRAGPSQPRPAAAPPPSKRPAAAPQAEALSKIFVLDGVCENHTPDEPKEIPTGKTVLTIEDGECRWPLGDVRSPDFHFCSHKTVVGLPYCEKHCRAAYTYYGKPKPLPMRGGKKIKTVEFA
jgi:GcrA cell cycle regulator